MHAWLDLVDSKLTTILIIFIIIVINFLFFFFFFVFGRLFSFRPCWFCSLTACERKNWIVFFFIIKSKLTLLLLLALLFPAIFVVIRSLLWGLWSFWIEVKKQFRVKLQTHTLCSKRPPTCYERLQPFQIFLFDLMVLQKLVKLVQVLAVGLAEHVEQKLHKVRHRGGLISALPFRCFWPH